MFNHLPFDIYSFFKDGIVNIEDDIETLQHKIASSNLSDCMRQNYIAHLTVVKKERIMHELCYLIEQMYFAGSYRIKDKYQQWDLEEEDLLFARAKEFEQIDFDEVLSALNHKRSLAKLNAESAEHLYPYFKQVLNGIVNFYFESFYYKDDFAITAENYENLLINQLEGEEKIYKLTALVLKRFEQDTRYKNYRKRRAELYLKKLKTTFDFLLCWDCSINDKIYANIKKKYQECCKLFEHWRRLTCVQRIIAKYEDISIDYDREITAYFKLVVFNVQNIKFTPQYAKIEDKFANFICNELKHKEHTSCAQY